MGRVPRLETTSAAEYGLFVFQKRGSWVSITVRIATALLLAVMLYLRRGNADLEESLDLRNLSLKCLAFTSHRVQLDRREGVGGVEVMERSVNRLWGRGRGWGRGMVGGRNAFP